MDFHPLLAWSAPSRPPHDRDRKWYVIAGSIAALVLLYALFTQAWTFAVVIVLLAVLYGLLHGKSHLVHTVRIAEQALYWDTKTIPWSELEGFWMLQGPGYVELHIEWKQKGKERLVVQTGDQEPADIASSLARFLPSFADRREKLLDYIIRICKL